MPTTRRGRTPVRIARNFAKRPVTRRSAPCWGPLRRGTTLAFTAVCLVPMVSVMALLLDGGLLMSEHRHARAVVDTAAMSAAYSLFGNYSLDHGLDPYGTARTAALNNAAANGYGNDVTASVVTV